MAVHHLALSPAVLHAQFGPDMGPVLSIESGDTAIFRTLDASWGRMGKPLFGIEPEIVADAECFVGHALCGPIAVRGAEPGDVLEVQIMTIRPGSWGWTAASGDRPGNERLGLTRSVVVGWQLDPVAATATDTAGLGVTLTIDPFMGWMGNMPAASGQHSTAPPRCVGGNLDCRELVPGSTLWLPVEVEGALFSVGDGHALQGDGEVSGTAIECPMEHVELGFEVRRDLRLTAPRASTPAGFITFGLDDDLDVATEMALVAMLDHMQDAYRIERSEALVLASLAVDMRITQIVNTVKGVHAILPWDAVRRVTPATVQDGGMKKGRPS